MKRTNAVFVTVLLLLVTALPIWGQTTAESELTTENRILGIEAGLLAGYRLFDNEVVAGQGFALNLNVAQNVQVGFTGATLTGAAVTDIYGMLRIGYFITPSLGFNISVGSGTFGGGAATPSIGAGVFFDAFTSRSTDSFSTALKIKLDYLTDTTRGMTSGTIAFGLAGVFGL